ncbi:MAG: 30S ribosomal protein S8 [Chloroflexi bacterium]|nr:30S ribosomal protein S8 [Chloroflexota bacterium]
MPVTDPIADMLTRIRNAYTVNHDVVPIPASKMKVAIAKLLKEEGFIEGYEVVPTKSVQDSLRIYLHYGKGNESGIRGLKRVSKSGLRVYVKKGEIPRYYGGLGVAFLSTSEGVMTGKQAWQKKLGGELLCYVW